MGPSFQSQFVHPDNRNGTYDSICRECFATVANATAKEQLEKPERLHVCDPWTRERLDRLRHREH